MSGVVLKSCVKPVTEISGSEKETMFELMTAHYEAVTREVFEADLAWKDEVVTLQDRDGRLRGFTTVALNPAGVMAEGDVLFSGDTIIDRACWGTQELVRGFCRRAGELKRESGRRLFWFLISKGHRTYLYLPLFSRRFHPHPDTAEEELAGLADRLARSMFGPAWDAERGVIRFREEAGRLRGEIAGDRESNKWATFFRQRNPGWRRGDELVCMTELAEENLRRGALVAFKEGLA